MRIKADGFGAGLGIPEAVTRTMIQSPTCEFAVRGPRGPITYPMAAYPGTSGKTVDVSVGLIFPWKAELARRDPRVCLSWCRPTQVEGDTLPVVVLLGHAAVRDRDLQANTDRYYRLLVETQPGMFGRLPRPLARGLSFYLARIWIEVTPLRILWWPDADLTQPPLSWSAPSDTELPMSDSAPTARNGSGGRSLFTGSPDWSRNLDRALRLGPPIVSVLDGDGQPVTFAALRGRRTAEGVELDLPSLPVRPLGPACLTFHRYGPRGGIPFQENYSFAGTISEGRNGPVVAIDRQLLRGSLPNPFAMAHTFFNIWRMRSRLSVEAARRGQAVPQVQA